MATIICINDSYIDKLTILNGEIVSLLDEMIQKTAYSLRKCVTVGRTRLVRIAVSNSLRALLIRKAYNL